MTIICPYCKRELDGNDVNFGDMIKCGVCSHRFFLSPTDYKISTPTQRQHSQFVSAFVDFFTRRTPKGRSSRAAYWWSFLAFIITHISVIYLYNTIENFLPIYYLLFVPSVTIIHYLFFCLFVRRLHDTGKTAALAVILDVLSGVSIVNRLLFLIPSSCIDLPNQILTLYALYCCAKSGDPNKNEYGDIPR